MSSEKKGENPFRPEPKGVPYTDASVNVGLIGVPKLSPEKGLKRWKIG